MRDLRTALVIGLVICVFVALVLWLLYNKKAV